MKDLIKSAKYHKNQIQTTGFITTLTFITKKGNYNVFKMDNGDKYIVIFQDQPELLHLVQDNCNSIFLLHFLLSSNNKCKYTINIEGDYVEDVYTVAKAEVIKLCEEKPKLHIISDLITLVEK